MISVDGSGIRQSNVFDARYHGQVKIEYQPHPLYGRSGQVVRRINKVAYGNSLEICIDDEIVSVPVWMTHAEHCRQLTCGHDPVPTLPSLMRVLRWLDDLPQEVDR